MTSSIVARLVTSALVFACVTGPSSAGAATSSASSPLVRSAERYVDLAVSFTPRYSGTNIAPIAGELLLHYLPTGTLSGTFRERAGDADFALSGTTAGTRTFFDIKDGFDSFHIDGALRGEGGATQFLGYARIGRSDYFVSAAPCLDETGVVSADCHWTAP